MIKIINDSNLSYQDVGFILDEWLLKDKGDHYYNQILYTKVILNNKKYFVQARYLKHYMEFLVKEVTDE